MPAGVYALQLNNNKYYVGKSDNIEKRLQEHKSLSDKCAKFIKDSGGVKKNIDLLTSNNDLNIWEQQETLAQMLDKGFNNVRGWEFTNSNPLTYEECVSIKTLLFGSGDLCRNCGNPGHFAQDCKSQKAEWFIELEKCMNQKPQSNNVFQNIIKKQQTDSKITDFELEIAKTNRGKCKKCELNIDKDELKIGIKAVNLKKQEYIKWYHIDCFKKDNNIDMSIVNNFRKKNKSINQKTDKKEKKTIPQQITFHKNCCYRCGNSNHYANNCYATYDVNGNYIDDSEDSEDSEDSSEEVWECSYCGKEFDSEKGALFHENRYCRKKRYY